MVMLHLKGFSQSFRWKLPGGLIFSDTHNKNRHIFANIKKEEIETKVIMYLNLSQESLYFFSEQRMKIRAVRFEFIADLCFMICSDWDWENKLK